jgi:hypothetical protein
LRPLDTGGKQGGHLADRDPLPTFAAEIVDVPPHDESRLPHMYPVDEIARLFPTIHAAPELPNVDDYNARRDDDDGYLQQQPHDVRVSEMRRLRGEQENVNRKKIPRQPSRKVAQ